MAKCISEEHLADYIQNRLPENQKEKVERHLAMCEACLDTFLILKQMLRSESCQQIPLHAQEVRERTKAKVLGETNHHPLEKKLKQWKQKTVGLKNTIYDFFSFSPSEIVYVRSTDNNQHHDNSITLNKKFNNIEAEIEIKKQRSDAASIRVGIIKESSQSEASIRVTLFENDREVASFPLSMPVFFQDIFFGSYLLVFSINGVKEGEYRFKIEGSLND